MAINDEQEKKITESNDWPKINGSFDAECISAEKKESAKGNLMFALEWTIMFSGKDRKVLSWVLITDEGYPAVLYRHCCRAIGLEEEYDRDAVEEHMFKGRTCTLTIEQGEDDDWPQVKEYEAQNHSSFNTRQNPNPKPDKFDKEYDQSVPF